MHFYKCLYANFYRYAWGQNHNSNKLILLILKYSHCKIMANYKYGCHSSRWYCDVLLLSTLENWILVVFLYPFLCWTCTSFVGHHQSGFMTWKNVNLHFNYIKKHFEHLLRRVRNLKYRIWLVNDGIHFSFRVDKFIGNYIE